MLVLSVRGSSRYAALYLRVHVLIAGLVLALAAPSDALAQDATTTIDRGRLASLGPPWHLAAMAGALVVAAGLVRRFAPQRRRRLRPALVLFALHVGGYALGHAFAYVAWTDRVSQIVWFTSLMGTFLIIHLSALIFFDIVLRAIRLEAANIVSDLLVGCAYIVAFIQGMHTAGVNLSSIVATSAVVSGVVGLSLAPTIGNILGGVALQLDNSVSEGDWIQLDANTQGKVKAIRWRHTVVETRNWDTIIVPNATLLSANITILGKRTDQALQRRYWVFFNVDFRHSPSDVIAVLNQALQSAPLPNVAADPKPHCILLDLARDGRDSFGYYAVRYWLTDLAVDDPTNSMIRERIHSALKRAGIPLALPATAVFLSQDDAEHQQAKREREQARRVELLRRLVLFQHFNETELAQVANDLVYAAFARNEVITQQGHEAHWLYILARGTCEVVLDDAGVKRQVGAIRAPDFFGEMAVMTGERRSATVIATSACDCYRLDKDAFKRIVVERPELATLVSTVLVQRREGLRQVQENLDAEQKRNQMDGARDKLLAQMKGFFGLG